jgi:predicted RNA binding protein YcfA (HicA-like mRNA interferase family)
MAGARCRSLRHAMHGLRRTRGSHQVLRAPQTEKGPWWDPCLFGAPEGMTRGVAARPSGRRRLRRRRSLRHAMHGLRRTRGSHQVLRTPQTEKGPWWDPCLFGAPEGMTRGVAARPSGRRRLRRRRSLRHAMHGLRRTRDSHQVLRTPQTEKGPWWDPCLFGAPEGMTRGVAARPSGRRRLRRRRSLRHAMHGLRRTRGSHQVLRTPQTEKGPWWDPCLFGAPEGMTRGVAARPSGRRRLRRRRSLRHAMHGLRRTRGSHQVLRTPQTEKGPWWDPCLFGAPEGIRTPGLCLRRAALYPAELRAQNL